MSTCFTIGISLLLPCTFKHFLHFQHCTDQCCTLSAHSRQNCWKGSSYVMSMISDEEEGICVLCRFGMTAYTDNSILLGIIQLQFVLFVWPIAITHSTVRNSSIHEACSFKGVSLHALNFLVLYCYWYSFISVCVCVCVCVCVRARVFFFFLRGIIEENKKCKQFFPTWQENNSKSDR